MVARSLPYALGFTAALFEKKTPGLNQSLCRMLQTFLCELLFIYE